MKDPSSKKRSLAKALTWRIVSMSITCTLLYAFTGDLSLSLGIGAIDSIFLIIAYFYHERVWHQVQWGKEKPNALKLYPPSAFSHGGVYPRLSDDTVPVELDSGDPGVPWSGEHS